MSKLNRLLMASLLLVFPLAACDEGEDPVEPDPEPAVGTVSGTVSVEGSGLANVTVQLAGASAQSMTTGANGTYSFTNVVEGNYSVALSGIPADVVFSQTTQTVSINTDGQTATADFNGQYVRTASILASVTRGDGTGVTTQVNVTGPDGYDTTLGTNANGQVQFTGLRAGSYDVSLPNPPEGFDITEQTVDLNTGQSAQVNFTGERELVDPEVVIESIMAAGAIVDPDSIAGRVDVTVNVRPQGNAVESIELLARDVDTGDLYRIGRQTFSVGAPLQQEEDDAVDVVFSWNSDLIRAKDGSQASVRLFNETSGEFESIPADAMRPYHPIYLNGGWELMGRVTVSEFDDPFNAIVEVTSVNMDAVNLGVFSDNTDWESPVDGEFFENFIIDDGTGLRWLSGDVHITVYPIIYSAPFDINNPVIQRASWAMTGFVGGATAPRGGTELTAPNNPDGTFTFTFCEGATANDGVSTCYASIAGFNTGIPGAQSLALVTKTQFGQFGPTLANVKTINFFDTDLQSGTGVVNDVLRIDNESPTAATLDFSDLPHPANSITGVSGFSRTGIGGGTNLGWVAWGDQISDIFDASGSSDAPNTFPTAFPGLGIMIGDPLMGIGLPTGIPHENWLCGPDYDGGSVVTDCNDGNEVLITQFADLTGADLPEETDSPGLIDAGSAPGTPFSDTELDYGYTGRHWDEFGNWTLASITALLGVDGLAPIYSDALGLTQMDPNNAADTVPVGGSIYDTYDDDQHIVQDLANGGTEDVDYGQQPFVLGGKTPGQVMGWTTDRGNGFSGVAGVVVHDYEQGCDEGAGELVCFSETTSRHGYKLQPVLPGGATTVLPFTWDGEGENVTTPGADDFMTDLAAWPTEPDFHAYVATVDIPGSQDGYQNHDFMSYDRAGNLRTVMPVSENIADHDGPDVGNVQMPTVVTFNFTSSYTFGGEVFDQADLKKTDFSFDFNGITTLQEYVDPAAGTPAGPGADVDGNAYVGQSLQLPLMNVAHAPWGSASIIRGTDLSINTNFLGCLLRIDEEGADVTIQRPRGPRWRSWDHGHGYGQVNTQFNSFVLTSVPGCSTVGSMTSGIIPDPTAGPGADPDGADDVLGTVDDEYGWLFLNNSDGRPVIVLKGTTATFVPNVDFDQIAMYYLDTAGRAILLDTGDSSNWTLIVSDTGVGAYGRSYEYTYTGPLPSDINDEALTNGTVASYFFVMKLTGSLAGHGLIWDGTLN